MQFIQNNVFNGFAFLPNIKYASKARKAFVFSFGIYSFLNSNIFCDRVVFVNTTLFFYDDVYGISKNLFEKFLFNLEKREFNFLKYFYKLCGISQKEFMKFSFLIQSEKEFKKYKKYLLEKLKKVKSTFINKNYLISIFKNKIKNKEIIFFISKNDKVLPYTSQKNFLNLLKTLNIPFKYYEIKDNHFPKFLERYYELEFSKAKI